MQQVGYPCLCLNVIHLWLLHLSDKNLLWALVREERVLDVRNSHPKRINHNESSNISLLFILHIWLTISHLLFFVSFYLQNISLNKSGHSLLVLFSPKLWNYFEWCSWTQLFVCMFHHLTSQISQFFQIGYNKTQACCEKTRANNAIYEDEWLCLYYGIWIHYDASNKHPMYLHKKQHTNEI